MNYSINQNTVVQEGNGSSIIPIGINEDCYLTGWEVKEASNGSIYLWFGFTEDAIPYCGTDEDKNKYIDIQKIKNIVL